MIHTNAFVTAERGLNFERVQKEIASPKGSANIKVTPKMIKV